MRVLVACEFSGIVRDAFRARGHDAWSCDLLPTEAPGQHIQDDVLKHLDESWDLMVGHPPCTDVAISGARFFKTKGIQRIERAIEFFNALLWADIPKICLENPISLISRFVRPPDQIIQPWQFGHGEVKATCLWLVQLPTLKPTDIVDGRHARVHHESPGPDRWKRRSRFYAGFAKAMAEQWG